MINVLFLCLKNNGLSQIAEGLLNKIGHSNFRAYSAGFYPAPIPPVIQGQMRELAVEPANHYPKSISEFTQHEPDYVIWVGGEVPPVDFRVKGKRKPLSVWHVELPDAEQKSPADYAKELSREAHLLLTRMHLFVLSHHQEVELLQAV